MAHKLILSIGFELPFLDQQVLLVLLEQLLLLNQQLILGIHQLFIVVSTSKPYLWYIWTLHGLRFLIRILDVAVKIFLQWLCVDGEEVRLILVLSILHLLLLFILIWYINLLNYLI